MNIKFQTKSSINKNVGIDKMKDVLWMSMVKMHELAVSKVPVDTGRLKTSIILTPVMRGADEYVLAAGTNYAIDIEFGTTPHRIPSKIPGTNIHPLTGWSRRVLKDEKAAYAVAAKIAKVGTESQPYFRPSLQEVKTIWLPKYWNKIL